MVRNPCCEKMGLKKGPWATEEDLILANYIKQYGHDNWRALPKQAGLMRCGKSCRLRWMNYLRPDIKRGNFTREEEETIVKLHQELGNRWSVIASKLPGRTDNEIKNIWNTNLKKRVNKLSQPETKIHIKKTESYDLGHIVENSWNSNSPLNSSSEISSVDVGFSNAVNDSIDKFPDIDESFWSDDLSTGISESQFSIDTKFSSDLSFISGIDFWSDVLSNEQELVEWPELW